MPVQFKKEPNEPGYGFEVEVHAAVEGLSTDETEEIIELSSTRCPVFKLVQDSHTVSLKIVPYTE